MASNLDRRLLDADLDRIVALASPEVIRLDCDQGGEDCLAQIRDNPRGTPIHRKYTIVRAADLDDLRRELVDFRRRWKEVYGR